MSPASSPMKHPPGSSGGPGESREGKEVSHERGAAIPRDYKDDRLVAMVRDPKWMFLYWELEGSASQRALEKCGKDSFAKSAWVLRVHNLTKGTQEDIPIVPEARNWYLPVEEDTRYRAEICIVTPEKEVISVAQSKEVATPRQGVSKVTDEQWSVLDKDYRRVMELSGGSGPIGSSGLSSSR